MKRKINFLLASIVMFGIVLSLAGTSLASQAAPVEKQQGQNRKAPKPIPASNIEVVKKVFSEDMGKGKDKGKPSPSKPESGAATGILGDYPATGNKYAVVIGICDYPGTAYDLCESDGDSLHMYKALIELYGYKAENIMLFKDGGGFTGPALGNVAYNVPTRDNIYNAIMDIEEDTALSPDDEVVFFFSGHGTKGMAADGDEEAIDEAIVVWNTENDKEGDITYIWDGELKNWFSDFGTARIVFVFDSCLAGGMNDVASDGRVVNMATGETQSAYVYSTAGEDVDGDGIKDGEGVFSRYFVNEGMLQGLADKYDHIIDIPDVVVEEAFDYAKANIPSYLKVRQKPVISDKFDNDLLL
ncbi:caspase family protein [Patescibacteria group bacterium]|nr:caspase family protein [Patescibacteria group bacterium]